MTKQEDATLPKTEGSEDVVSEAVAAQAAEEGEGVEPEVASTEAEANTDATSAATETDEPAEESERDESVAAEAADGEPVSEAESVASDAEDDAGPIAESESADAGEPEASSDADVDADAADDTVSSAESDDDDEDDSKRVVRMLAVGQQVDGVVKRITDFGAFVDIGVGRDGLIHISELSLQRVGKVSDVLSANQQVQPWIKKLDRKRNRISLTLIDPEQKTIRDLQSGEIVEGTVTRILPYGAFIDIGIGRDALLHVREMSNKYVEKPEDVVKVGETLEARIIELSRRRGRVDLSLKGLRDEPEDEDAQAEVIADEEIEEYEDEFADVEVLSPMELAFKRAVEAEGDEIQVSKKKGKKGRSQEARAIQDEIIARTLDTGRK